MCFGVEGEIFFSDSSFESGFLTFLKLALKSISWCLSSSTFEDSTILSGVGILLFDGVLDLALIVSNNSVTSIAAGLWLPSLFPLCVGELPEDFVAADVLVSGGGGEHVGIDEFPLISFSNFVSMLEFWFAPNGMDWLLLFPVNELKGRMGSAGLLILFEDDSLRSTILPPSSKVEPGLDKLPTAGLPNVRQSDRGGETGLFGIFC